MEILRYLVDLKNNQTTIVILHHTTSAFGDVMREDSLQLARVEDWTIESLQAAVIAAIEEVQAKQEKPQAIAVGAAKFEVPLRVVK